MSGGDFGVSVFCLDALERGAGRYGIFHIPMDEEKRKNG